MNIYGSTLILNKRVWVGVATHISTKGHRHTITATHTDSMMLCTDSVTAIHYSLPRVS